MVIRVDNELAIAADGAEQKTGFLARGNRAGGQRQGHGNLEEIIIPERVGARPPIVGKVPSIPVGEAAGLTHVRFIKRDEDRKSTRLNSSHITISYAVFCL